MSDKKWVQNDVYEKLLTSRDVTPLNLAQNSERKIKRPLLSSVPTKNPNQNSLIKSMSGITNFK